MTRATSITPPVMGSEMAKANCHPPSEEEDDEGGFGRLGIGEGSIPVPYFRGGMTDELLLLLGELEAGKKEPKVALLKIEALEAVRMTLRPVMPKKSKAEKRMSPGTADLEEASALVLVLYRGNGGRSMSPSRRSTFP